MVDTNFDCSSNSSKGSTSGTSSRRQSFNEVPIGQKDIADVYNEIGGDQYDEWAKKVNFNAP